MNRRDFTKSLAAAMTIPALPGKAIAAVSAPAAAVTSRYKNPYLWAEFISRVHNQSSPEFLHRLLKLPLEDATAIYNQLLSNNVIAPQNAYGISRAINPYPHAPLGMSPTQTAQTASTAKPEQTVQRAEAQDFSVDDDDGDSLPVNQEVSGSEDDSASDLAKSGKE